MPTGYTYVVGDKDASFEEFVWHCARAFGAFMHLRDSMDSKLTMPEHSDYHKNAVQKAKEELDLYNSMTLKQAEAFMKMEHEASIKSAKESLVKVISIKIKFNKVLKYVKDWSPPTPDHKALKDFMIGQLESSIKFDCDEAYYVERLEKQKVKETPKKWLQSKISGATNDIKYHTDESIKGEDRYKKLVGWIDDLRKSVPPPSGLFK
jgi:hypothetical protein